MSSEIQNRKALSVEVSQASAGNSEQAPLGGGKKLVARVVFKKSNPRERMIFTSFPKQDDMKLIRDPENAWWSAQKAKQPELFSEMDHLEILTLEERKCPNKADQKDLWKDCVNKP